MGCAGSKPADRGIAGIAGIGGVAPPPAATRRTAPPTPTTGLQAVRSRRSFSASAAAGSTGPHLTAGAGDGGPVVRRKASRAPRLPSLGGAFGGRASDDDGSAESDGGDADDSMFSAPARGAGGGSARDRPGSRARRGSGSQPAVPSLFPAAGPAQGDSPLGPARPSVFSVFADVVDTHIESVATEIERQSAASDGGGSAGGRVSVASGVGVGASSRDGGESSTVDGGAAASSEEAGADSGSGSGPGVGAGAGVATGTGAGAGAGGGASALGLGIAGGDYPARGISFRAATPGGRPPSNSVSLGGTLPPLSKTSATNAGSFLIARQHSEEILFPVIHAPISDRLPALPQHESFATGLGIRFGSADAMGRRSSMEDRHRVYCPVDDGPAAGMGFFGVYDGHAGPQVAEFLKQHLHTHIISALPVGARGQASLAHPALPAFIEEAFAEVDQAVLDDPTLEAAGSCALIALTGPASVLLAHVGDCIALLCSAGRAVQLSRPHKPDSPRERRRIEAEGGIVTKGRIHGITDVSRSFGDATCKSDRGRFMTCEPQVLRHVLGPEDEFLILASDGLLERMQRQQAVNFVKKRLLADPPPSVQEVCEELVHTVATKLRGPDNVTAIIIAFFQHSDSTLSQDRAGGGSSNTIGGSGGIGGASPGGAFRYGSASGHGSGSGAALGTPLHGASSRQLVPRQRRGSRGSEGSRDSPVGSRRVSRSDSLTLDLEEVTLVDTTDHEPERRRRRGSRSSRGSRGSRGSAS